MMNPGKIPCISFHQLSNKHKHHCLLWCLLLQVRDQRVRLLADPDAGLLVQPVSDVL
jgi:hypothetical protein